MRAATILALASMAFLSTPITALPNQSPSDTNLFTRQVPASCNILNGVISSIGQAKIDLNSILSILNQKNSPDPSSLADLLSKAGIEAQTLATDMNCPLSNTKLVRRQVTATPCKALNRVHSSLSHAGTAMNALGSLPNSIAAQIVVSAIQSTLQSSLSITTTLEGDLGC